VSPARRTVVAVLVVWSVVCPTVAVVPTTATAGATGDVGTDSNAGPGTATGALQIAAIYPNPVTDGDRGEFVVVEASPGTALDRYHLTDGEDRIPLPNVTAGGRVVLTGAPALVRNLTGGRVVALPQSLALANGGERVRIRRGNETVASARYQDAPEGELGRYDDRRTLTWRPLGRTDRPVVSAPGGTVRAFVLPDAPDVALSVVRNADRRVYLAGYTLTSRRVERALVRAHERGVDVRVLLEGDPVGGITRREARLLDRLVEHGVTVRVLGGPRARYAYHHVKYAVADDRAVVLTENWKPAGTGGRSSRGWGVVVSQPAVVEGLSEIFRADAGGIDAIPWRKFRRGRSFSRGNVANGTYSSEFDPARLSVDGTRLLLAPDNAGEAVVAALDGATESIDVVQLSIDGPDQRFLRATVRAARRGVAVRVLLSDAWYVREENRRLVEHLRERADGEDLPIRAKLAPDGGFEKIHAKGVIVDGDEVLLGSLNWNGESIRENREVVLALSGEAVGSYYRRVFEADWGAGAGRRLPVGIVAAVLGTLVLAVLVARRIDFAGDDRVGVEG